MIDEVLAVGDAEFQEKCLGKRSEVAGGGRTILFVSHNKTAVRQLCQNGIWLQGRQIEETGPISLVSRAYLDNTRERTNSGDLSTRNISGDGSTEVISYCVTNGRGKPSPPPGTNEELIICVNLNVKASIARPAVGIDFTNEQGVVLTSLSTLEQGTMLPSLPEGGVTISHIYVRAEDCIVFRDCSCSHLRNE